MAESVDGEIVLFEGITGTEVKRATGSGLVKVASGVMSIAAAGTDYAAATAVARANHTGTQTASTISDFSAAADARIDAEVPNVNSRVQAVAVTATSGGTGTAIVPANADFATVTSSDANYIVVLPAGSAGIAVGMHVGGNGFELRSATPASVPINSGTGSGAESAIPANTDVICYFNGVGWICSNTDAAGVTTVTEAAAP